MSSQVSGNSPPPPKRRRVSFAEHPLSNPVPDIVLDHLVEARVHDDRHGLFVKTRAPDQFYLMLNEVVAEGEIEIESIAPVDDDLSAVYEYLIGSQ